MRKFRITVNGKAYDVAVEELDSSTSVSKPAIASPTRQPSIPKPVMNKPKTTSPKQVAPTTTSNREEKVEVKTTTTPKESVASEGTSVNAPMPGVVLDIKVNSGDTNPITV